MLEYMRDLRVWSQHVTSWRRAVHDLYAAVRAEEDPATAHAAWVAGRTRLFETHPASPRQSGQALRHAAYDPAYRFVVEPVSADSESWAATTGSDGAVPFERAARVELPGLGALDVWWLV